MTREYREVDAPSREPEANTVHHEDCPHLSRSKIDHEHGEAGAAETVAYNGVGVCTECITGSDRREFFERVAELLEDE